MCFAGSFKIYEFLEIFKLSELTVTNKGLFLSAIKCGVSTKSKLERFHDIFPHECIQYQVYNLLILCKMYSN